MSIWHKITVNDVSLILTWQPERKKEKAANKKISLKFLHDLSLLEYKKATAPIFVYKIILALPCLEFFKISIKKILTALVVCRCQSAMR